MSSPRPPSISTWLRRISPGRTRRTPGRTWNWPWARDCPTAYIGWSRTSISRCATNWKYLEETGGKPGRPGHSPQGHRPRSGPCKTSSRRGRIPVLAILGVVRTDDGRSVSIPQHTNRAGSTDLPLEYPHRSAACRPRRRNGPATLCHCDWTPLHIAKKMAGNTSKPGSPFHIVTAGRSPQSLQSCWFSLTGARFVPIPDRGGIRPRRTL